MEGFEQMKMQVEKLGERYVELERKYNRLYQKHATLEKNSKN